MINIPGIQDESFKKQTLQEAESIVKRAKEKCNRVLNILEKREKK